MRRPNYGIPPASKLGVPNAQMDDLPQRCISINAEWLPYLEGVVRDLADDRRYDLTTQEEHDHIFNQVQMLLTRIAEAVECVEPVVLTQQTVWSEYQQPSGTNGGASVANVWSLLPLNTLLQDDTGNVTLSGNRITLPVGLWDIDYVYSMRSGNVATGRIRMENFLGVVSTNRVFQAGDVVEFSLRGVVPITLPVAQGFQYRVSAAQAVNGLGLPLSVAGEVEHYARLIARRIFLS